MEVRRNIEPEENFLTLVRKLCTDHDVILIYTNPTHFSSYKGSVYFYLNNLYIIGTNRNIVDTFPSNNIKANKYNAFYYLDKPSINYLGEGIKDFSKQYYYEDTINKINFMVTNINGFVISFSHILFLCF